MAYYHDLLADYNVQLEKYRDAEIRFAHAVIAEDKERRGETVSFNYTDIYLEVLTARKYMYEARKEADRIWNEYVEEAHKAFELSIRK